MPFIPQFPSSRQLLGLGLGLGLILSLAITTAAPLAAQIQIYDPWPEACSSITLPYKKRTISVPTVGDFLEITYTSAALTDKKIAIIFNGNNFPESTYQDLVDHLVQRGYVAANAQRPGFGGDGAYVIDVIDEVLGALSLAPSDPDLRVGLVGHSQGGRLIVEAAALNLADEIGAPIDALVGLAPASEASSVLNEWHMPPYFAIYGSQDEDLDGYGGAVMETFRAYDQVGHESTTTCNSPPCVALVPTVDKTMVFAYGADHAGLLGYATSGVAWLPQSIEYIDPDDQLCLTKAYTTAFLNWHLRGDTYYKSFIRDEWRPLVINAMGNDAADGVGHGIGEPIRMFHQISPEQRKVIQNFQVGDGAPSTSASVLVQHAAALGYSGNPFYVRHNTGGVFVGWPNAGLQWARWDVPPFSTVGSTYSHLSIRVGQVAGIDAQSPHGNIPGQDVTIYLGVSDTSGGSDLFALDVPYPDPYLDNLANARTAMSTFRIETADFDGEVDLDNIEYVYLIMPAGSQGTLLVDSIEWHRD